MSLLYICRWWLPVPMSVLVFSGAQGSDTQVTRLNEVQSAYLQFCGGCHGIQGTSAPREVPSLRGQVGSFMCTPEGRAYLVRLPNVALAPISDQMLSDVMNFVVFDLGGSNSHAPNTMRGVAPFTAAEVAQLRKQPLTDTGLAAYRARVVANLIERCAAPASLRAYSVEISPACRQVSGAGAAREANC